MNPSKSQIEFVEQVAGIRSFDFVGWPHAESQVWKIEFKEPSNFGQAAYLKIHRQPRKFQQETAAYRDWVPQLKQAANQSPQIIAESKELKAILLSSIEASVVSTLDLPVRELRDVYEQAGKYLHEFHSIEFTDEDIPVDEALEKRLHAWAERAKGLIDSADLSWVDREITKALPLLKDYRRVPCHRDFTPRNWLKDRSGQLYVIDFEHSRPDLFFLDLERMWSRDWADHPELAEAFWAGYQSRPTDQDMWLLNRCSALVAVSTIVWSIEHQDADFEAHGRRVLERLMKQKLTANFSAAGS